jgi:hypothetical protein
VIDESTIHDATCELPGGCVGQVLMDLNPNATLGRVRPFVWSYLLLRGAVRRREVAGALAGHVSEDDIRQSNELPEDQRNPLEITIDTVLGEMVGQGLLRLAHRDDDLFVLNPLGLQQAVSLVCSLNAQLPDHLLHDVGFSEARSGPHPHAAPPAPAAPVHQGNESSGLHGRWVGNRFRSIVRLRQMFGFSRP